LMAVLPIDDGTTHKYTSLNGFKTWKNTLALTNFKLKAPLNFRFRSSLGYSIIFDLGWVRGESFYKYLSVFFNYFIKFGCKTHFASFWKNSVQNQKLFLSKKNFEN
jgi:hypothetical protein